MKNNIELFNIAIDYCKIYKCNKKLVEEAIARNIGIAQFVIPVFAWDIIQKYVESLEDTNEPK